MGEMANPLLPRLGKESRATVITKVEQLFSKQFIFLGASLGVKIPRFLG